MSDVKNGVNTLTPADSSKPVAELANVSKTVTVTVELNEADLQYLFVYKYAKNWYGILSQSKIDAHRTEWTNEYVASKMTSDIKAIKEQIRKKQILAEFDALTK